MHSELRLELLLLRNRYIARADIPDPVLYARHHLHPYRGHHRDLGMVPDRLASLDSDLSIVGFVLLRLYWIEFPYSAQTLHHG